jgi:hypothetical protein
MNIFIIRDILLNADLNSSLAVDKLIFGEYCKEVKKEAT